MKKWLKRLAPVMLAIMLCFGSCLTAFAEDYGDPYARDYWFSYSDSNGDVYTWASYDSPFFVHEFDDGYYITCNSSTYIHQWKNGVQLGWGSAMKQIVSINSEGFSIVESNHDILYEDGTLFFHPILPVLAPVAEEAQMERVLEQLMMILPIGLACLVGWIALRKALSLLQGVLRQA